jgi:hypothetical protein
METSSKSRLVRDGDRQDAPEFGLSEKDILTIERLALDPEAKLGRTSIAASRTSRMSSVSQTTSACFCKPVKADRSGNFQAPKKGAAKYFRGSVTTSSAAGDIDSLEVDRGSATCPSIAYCLAWN